MSSEADYDRPQESHLRAAQAYARSFEGENRVNKHINKFKQRIDVIRDKIELSLISPYAYGDLFDCSIGFGRFVGRLPNIKTYSGMDNSESFVNHVRERYPEVKVSLGNLLDGIKQPDNTFDTVICIRTLPVLPEVDSILKDMARIAKPGGVIIITYGIKAVDSAINGHSYVSCSYNIREICQKNDLEIIARIKKDSLLGSLKRYQTAKRLFSSRFNLLPDGFYTYADKITSQLTNGFDNVFVIRKS